MRAFHFISIQYGRKKNNCLFLVSMSNFLKGSVGQDFFLYKIFLISLLAIINWEKPIFSRTVFPGFYHCFFHPLEKTCEHCPPATSFRAGTF